MVNIATMEAILRLKDQLSPHLKKAGANMQAFGDKLKANWKAIAAVTAAAVGIMIKAVLAYDAQVLAINQLNLALKNQGNFSKETSQAIQALASSQQDLTKYGDEVTLAAASQAAAFGLTGDQIINLIPLTQDYAAATGKDLGAAFLDVAKAADGQISMLSRYGIKTNEAMSSTERMTIVTDGLTKMFAGQAAVAADTFGGKTEQLGNEIGDLAEMIGEKLAPALMWIVDAVKGVAKWFKDLDPIWATVTASGVAFVAVAGSILLGITGIALALPTLTAGLATMGITLAGVGTAITAYLLPALAAVAVGLAAYKIAEWVFEWIGLRGAIDGVIDSWDQYAPTVSDAATRTGAMSAASEIAGRQVTDLAEATQILTEEATRLREEALAEVTPAVQTFGEAMAETWGVVVAATETLNEEMEATRKVAEETKIMADAKRLLGREAENLIEAQRVVNIEIARTAETITTTTANMDFMFKAVLNLKNETQLTAAVSQGMTEAEDKLARATAITGVEVTNLAVAEEVLRLIRTNSTMETITATQMAEELLRKRGLLREETDKLTGSLPPVIAKTKDATDATFNWKEMTGDLTMAMGGIGSALAVFGIDIDSVIGKVTKLISTFEGLFKSISSIVGSLTGGGGIPGLGGLLGGGGGGGGGLVGSIAGLFGGGAAIPGIGTTAAGVGGGLGGGGAAAGGGLAGGMGGVLGSIGSTVSAGASAVVSAITPVLAAIPVAGWIALAGIGTVLAIKKLFGGPSKFEVAGEELGKVFGMEFSRDAQFHIANQAEELFGGDDMAAIAYNMGGLISDALADGIDVGELDMLTEKAGDVYVAIGSGQLTAEQGQKALNESVAALLPHLGDLGEAGTFQLERMLAAADSTGVGFDNMNELAVAYVQNAQELGMGINTIVLESLGLSDALALVGQTSTQTAEELVKIGEEGAAGMEKIEGAAAVAAATLADKGASMETVMDEVAYATGEAAEEMRLKFENAAADVEASISGISTTINVDVNYSEHGKPGGGGGGGGDEGFPAQKGFYSAALPTDLTIRAHKGEEVRVTPAGETAEGQTQQPLAVLNVIHQTITLDGRVIEKKIVRTVNKARRLGDIAVASELADPRG